MKRIILGLSVLFILIQNGFAMSEKEYNKSIMKVKDKVVKQGLMCGKEAFYHKNNGDINICLKSIELLKKQNPISTISLQIAYGNTGILYEHSLRNYLKAYQYYIKSVQYGDVLAQHNLDILCKKHSWACK